MAPVTLVWSFMLSAAFLLSSGCESKQPVEKSATPVWETPEGKVPGKGGVVPLEGGGPGSTEGSTPGGGAGTPGPGGAAGGAPKAP